MSDHNYLRTEDPTFRLRADVFLLMMKGAGYAAVLCIVLGVFFAVTVGISNLLPEESKEAPDPTPLSLLAPQEATTTA
ncbi:RC-LH1 core complex protein PufX [Sulfitobacter sp. HNIBRBA3233]|uniref:RC-LH1 core complex protein PufX n=1 Tax=Sulfitobacter marinivivus TaxID=3158558 RepID=UPI0032DF210C